MLICLREGKIQILHKQRLNLVMMMSAVLFTTFIGTGKLLAFDTDEGFFNEEGHPNLPLLAPSSSLENTQSDTDISPTSSATVVMQESGTLTLPVPNTYSGVITGIVPVKTICSGVITDTVPVPNTDSGVINFTGASLSIGTLNFNMDDSTN